MLGAAVAWVLLVALHAVLTACCVAFRRGARQAGPRARHAARARRRARPAGAPAADQSLLLAALGGRWGSSRT